MGASDASYATAILLEFAQLVGEDVSGGAADIHKCFDQIVRPLVYAILEEAGMPGCIPKAYQNFFENMVCRNTLAGTIGQPYNKHTSIPQGDPFSMMVVALVLRPWVMEMRSYSVKPRLLADDLQVIPTGPNHLKMFQRAFDKTREHLEALGAKLAPTKSLVFSTKQNGK